MLIWRAYFSQILDLINAFNLKKSTYFLSIDRDNFIILSYVFKV